MSPKQRTLAKRTITLDGNVAPNYAAAGIAPMCPSNLGFRVFRGEQIHEYHFPCDDPPAKVKADIDPGYDSANEEIEGKPGSEERIRSLARWYANQTTDDEGEGGISPFAYDMADGLLRAISKGLGKGQDKISAGFYRLSGVDG